ncbi:MAG: sugar kinase, partial [bacterium]|nr:sugar kinase [bacterium]
SADLIGGMLSDDDELVIGSQMAEAGVVFSDGVESDFIEFNSGSIARFGVSSQRAILLTQHPSR